MVMKILLLQGECPYPPIKGPHTHSMGVIRCLLEQNDTELTVFGYVDGEKDKARWDKFTNDFGSVNVQITQTRSGLLLKAFSLIALLTGSLPVVAICPKKPIIELVRSLNGKKFDFVMLDRYLTFFDLAILEAKKVFLPHDAYSLAAKRGMKWTTKLKEYQLWFRRWILYRNMEIKAMRRYDLVCPVSCVDANVFRRYGGFADVKTLPITIDPKYFEPSAALETERPVLLIHGLYQFEAKCVQLVEFLQKDYPRLVTDFPDLTVKIWAKERHITLENELVNHPEIECVSWVDDYRSMLANATVYYYPMAQCSGVQTKLLEAMAVGLPVVAAPEVLDPILGCEYQGQEIAIRASEGSDAIGAISAFIRSKNLRRRYSNNARNFIIQHHSREAVSVKLARIIKSLN